MLSQQGQYLDRPDGHNTNVTDVNPPYGGYPKFVANGYSENHLALWMQQSGYNSYYAGKLFNAHTTDNYNRLWSMAIQARISYSIRSHIMMYYKASTTQNGQPSVNNFGEYSPDLNTKSAYEFLEEALS
ncbi:hypothetical protein QQZ08_005873 [Neonectria magnoliae]|uniref:Uncharacterized protein n=1 Tax=Neonectria magnoliae TaxID=2732573 RepID=A0ABR1I265_9HYPO